MGIKNLKENFSVQLDEDFDQYTSKELCAELKLRNMNSLNAKKSILIQRLNGEIDAPPKKRRKKAENQKDQIKCMFACILRRRTKTMQIRRFWEYSVPKKSKPKGHRAINRRYREKIRRQKEKNRSS